MHDPLFGPMVGSLGFGAIGFTVFLIIVALWAFTWKALALWHAARGKQRLWFIALLLVNTVGILEIIYLAWFRKDRNDGKSELFPFLAPLVQSLRERTHRASS